MKKNLFKRRFFRSFAKVEATNLRVKRVLFSLTFILSLLMLYFLIPFPNLIKRFLFPGVTLLGLLFLIFGFWLMFLAGKRRGKIRIFLLITGISATLPLIGSILHNLFYALVVGVPQLKFFFGFLEAVWFLIALLIAPICFLICSAISIVLINHSDKIEIDRIKAKNDTSERERTKQ